MSVKIFNKIHKDIKYENNINLFIRRLKTALIKKPYYSVREILDENLYKFVILVLKIDNTALFTEYACYAKLILTLLNMNECECV